MMDMRIGYCVPSVAHRWRAVDDSPVNVVISRHNEDLLEWTSAGLRELSDPGQSSLALAGIALESHIAANKDSADGPQGADALAGIPQDQRAIREIGVHRRIETIGFSEMDVGYMQ